MTRFLGTPLSGEDFSSSSSEAFSAKVASDTQARIRIDAGGRITWGSGSAAGDVYIYRYADNVIKFVGNVSVDALFVDGIEIDTTGATLDQVLKYNGTKFAPGTNVATVETLDAIGDVVLTTPQLNDVLRYSGGTWVNDVIPEINSLDDIAGVAITNPSAYQSLSYDGTNWINSDSSVATLVTNAEATSLAVGEVVYLYGAQGDRATVKRASNSSDTTSSKTVGIVAEIIAAGGTGAVVTQGYVTGINTSAYTPGDVLWLSSTAGQYTATKPTAPNHLVFIGVVARANVGNGIVYVKAQNGYELDEIHDVAIASRVSGDFLKYDGSVWVNDQINLGTDTVGNYVSDVTAGTGVTVTHTPSEGSSPTIAIGQAVATTDSPTFAGATLDGIRIGVTAANEIDTVSGNLTIDSAGGTVTIDDNLTVAGNLTVNGTTVTVNSTVTTIDDPVLTLGGDTAPSSDDNKDRGIEFRYHNGAAPKVGFFGYDDSTGRFVMIPDATNTSEVFSGGVGDIQAGTFFGDLSGTATNITASSNTSLTSLSNLTTVGTLGSLVVSGATSDTLVRITQTGAGNAFVVEDSTNPDSSPFIIDSEGRVTIGGTPLAGRNVLVNKSITGASSGYGIVGGGTVQSDVTGTASQFLSAGNTAAAAFTLGNYAHFYAFGVTTPGAGSTITTQIGFLASSSTTGATNNRGFQSDIASGAGRYNLYMQGTANNYLAGNLGIGTTGPTSLLHVQGGALGGTAGNELIVSQIRSTNSNADKVVTKFRRVSTGSDWGSAQAKIQRTIDVTDMGYVAFGGGGYAHDVRIGSGTTDIATFVSGGVSVVGNVALTGSVVFEGATANNFETTVSVTDPTADRTITFPDATGTVAISGQDVSFNDVTVAGNLNVTGSTFGSATLDVDNFKITLNAAVTGAPTLNGEIEVNRGTSADVRIRWNESLDLWEYTNDGTNYSRIGSALITISETPPSGSYTGDLWFESDSGITFVRYDNHWIEIGASGIGVVTSDGAPANPANGQAWFNSSNQTLSVYYDGAWIQVGAATLAGSLPLSAKGDMVAGIGSGAIGTLSTVQNGYILQSNSSQATGLEWVSPNVLIADFELASIMGAY